MHLTGSAANDTQRLLRRFAQLNQSRPVLLATRRPYLCHRLAVLTGARSVPVSLLTFAYDDHVVPDLTGEHVLAHAHLMSNFSVRELHHIASVGANAGAHTMRGAAASSALAECAARLLALPHLRRWYASSPSWRPIAGEAGRKFYHVPIGFGAHGLQMRTDAVIQTSPGLRATRGMRYSGSAPSRAQERSYEQALLLQVARARSSLQARRDACGASAAARSLVLLQTAVNESYGHGPRKARMTAMAAARRQFPELTNAYPTLGAEAYMQRLLEGLVSFSPRGTRADCWRHYEMLAAGTLVVASDHAALRPMLADLPVLLHEDWGTLSCARLLSELRRTHAALGQHEQNATHAKLTLSYWTRAVLDDARRSLAL